MNSIMDEECNKIIEDMMKLPIGIDSPSKLDLLKKVYDKVLKVKKQGLSFIEDHEEEEAKAFIEKHLGFPVPRPANSLLCVKMHIREEDVFQMKDDDGNPILGSDGKPKFIALPRTISATDKFLNITALVCACGPEAYKGERFERSGPWCKVGDWVIIARNEGTQFNYRGIPMQLIPHDRIMSVIEDPNCVIRD